MFCKECGRNIGGERICPFCGTEQERSSDNDFYSLSDYTAEAKNESNNDTADNTFRIRSNDEYGTKLRLTAGILQLFCGAFGIGRFYMGYKTYAVLQIAASVVTCGVGGVIWGAADGIAILTGRIMYDGDGKLLL